MASPITGFIYLYDTPFGNGQDWELVVVAPNSGGNAEFSIDNGATWFQCNQGYDATYQGYRYRPASFGSFPTPLFLSPSQVVQARIVGQTDVTKGVLGQVEENAGGDGFSYAYGATCSGTNININLVNLD